MIQDKILTVSVRGSNQQVLHFSCSEEARSLRTVLPLLHWIDIDGTSCVPYSELASLLLLVCKLGEVDPNTRFFKYRVSNPLRQD